jgi:amino acid transporter/nucleotide-binding universal stress UspA family protein
MAILETKTEVVGEEVEVSLARDLGLLDITMIGVGAMIGAGIFVLTGIAAGHAGPGLILAFFLNGIIAVIIGSAYAELGSCFPEAGGGYLWVRQGMSEVFGFLSGWMSWFAHAVACSLYALGFGSFSAEILQMAFGPLPFDRHIVAVGIGVLAALAFTIINFRGSSETGLVGTIVTSIKIFILLVLAGFGLFKIFGQPDSFTHYQPFLPEGWLGVFVAMGLTFIAFEGYEIIAQSGEEVKDPSRNIPRAIFLSIAIAVAIYLLVAFVVLGALNPPPGIPIYKFLGTLGELGMAEAAGQFMPYGKLILLLAGMASTMSALNATIYSSSRVSFAMGRDGNLPTVFGRIHPLTQTPHYAVFISGALIIAMAILLPIEDVAASADIMFLLLFMMVCYSLITLRERRPDLKRRFKMPFYPYSAWIGIVLCLALSLTLFDLSPIAWYTALLWIGGGLVVYFTFSIKQQEEISEKERPIIMEEVVAVKEYSVMVPVRDIRQAYSLSRLGAIMASVHDGELLALHVVRVPKALTIGEGRVFLRQGRAVLDVAIEQGRKYNVPVHTMVRLGRNVAHTIMGTAQQRNVNLLLLGWPGYSASRNVAFGSIIDLISENPPSDLAVVRFQKPWDVPRRILLPSRGRGPNARMAFEMARDIAAFYARPEQGGHQVEIQALHVITPGQSPADLEVFDQQIHRLSDLLHMDVKLATIQADTPTEGIARSSVDADLVIMGASGQGLFEQRIFGNIPEQVMQQSPTTIIMCKRYQGEVRNWLRHFFVPAPIDWDDPRLGGIRHDDESEHEEAEAIGVEQQTMEKTTEK